MIEDSDVLNASQKPDPQKEQSEETLFKRLAPYGIDALVACAVVFFSIGQLLLSSTYYLVIDEGFHTMSGFVQPDLGWATLSLLIVCALPLILRRRFPRAVWFTTLVLFLVTQAIHNGLFISVAAPVVALYTVAVERNRKEAVALLAFSVLAIMFVPTTGVSVGLSFLVRCQNIALIVAGTALGDSMRSRQDSIAAVEKRAIEAERIQEEVARRRVEEERVRIAREVHDITAHSLSAVTIQAAAAQRVIDKDPAAAKEAIQTIRSTSKGALDELRAMVGVLREPGSDVETVPTSTTQRLDDTMDYLRSAGIGVSFDDSAYGRDDVPAYVDVALFRIAREAVTNIVRHADATEVHVELSSDADNAYLVVEDNGRGAASVTVSSKDGGHGIMGMRERAVALGGTLEAEFIGPKPASGSMTKEFDGKTVDDEAFGDEPFNAEAIGVASPDEGAEAADIVPTGFIVRATIPIMPRGGIS